MVRVLSESRRKLSARATARRLSAALRYLMIPPFEVSCWPGRRNCVFFVVSCNDGSPCGGVVTCCCGGAPAKANTPALRRRAQALPTAIHRVRDRMDKRYVACCGSKEFNSILARFSHFLPAAHPSRTPRIKPNRYWTPFLMRYKMIAKRFEKRKRFGKTVRLKYIMTVQCSCRGTYCAPMSVRSRSLS